MLIGRNETPLEHIKNLVLVSTLSLIQLTRTIAQWCTRMGHISPRIGIPGQYCAFFIDHLTGEKAHSSLPDTLSSPALAQTQTDAKTMRCIRTARGSPQSIALAWMKKISMSMTRMPSQGSSSMELYPRAQTR